MPNNLFSLVNTKAGIIVTERAKTAFGWTTYFQRSDSFFTLHLCIVKAACSSFTKLSVHVARSSSDHQHAIHYVRFADDVVGHNV